MYPEEVRNYIAGTHSAVDKEFVKDWIRQDPSRGKELKELKKVWEMTADLELSNADEIDQAWSDLSSKMEQEGYPKTLSLNDQNRYDRKQDKDGWKVFLKVAAVLLVAIGLFAIYTYDGSQPGDRTAQEESLTSTIRAEYGEQVRFRLSDGTIVTLNAGSEIQHDSQYGVKNRELSLSGEAYFEVNNDGQSHPFIVTTKNARVRDIGTAFNINAYQERSATQVVVSDGEVEVSAQTDTSEPPKETVKVTRGDMVNVNEPDKPLEVKKANLDQALGWLNKKLIFDNEPFEKIVKRLERYYNIDITVEDNSLNQKVVKASFDNEQMEKVMSVLAISLGAQHEIEKNSVSFRSED